MVSLLVDDYNDNVRDIQKIPSMGREYTLGILVGRWLVSGHDSR